jgi:hypothetical protein
VGRSVMPFGSGDSVSDCVVDQTSCCKIWRNKTLHYSQIWRGILLLSQVTQRIRAFTLLPNDVTTIETCGQKDLGFDCRKLTQIKCACSTGRLEEIGVTVIPQFRIVNIHVIVVYA